MAKCPFAVWMPLDGSPGAYVRGHPFKIVHHTTEGSSADAAFATIARPGTFRISPSTTGRSISTPTPTWRSAALKHPPGGTETNRSSAVQIELVGFAGRPKSGDSRQNMARLCRWIERRIACRRSGRMAIRSHRSMAGILLITIGANAHWEQRQWQIE